MVQKVNFNNLTGDSLTIGNTTISGTGVTVGGAPLAAGATQYANTSQLPKTNLNFGEFALVGNTLYITNSVGWYSVALINQSPSLSISISDISLGATGNTINFTYTASDPDGPTPTVTVETTANTSQANVTVHTSNSTVTVENLSAEGYSANITLTASDGIDMTYGTVTLNVVYQSELWDDVALSIGTSSTNGLDNSTFVDRSTNAHTVTTSGAPVQTAFHPYLDNWSVEFDGSGDYLRWSNVASLGTGAFTVEGWIYLNALDGVLAGSVVDSSTLYWVIGITADGRVSFQTRNGATQLFGRSSVGSVEAGKWYHLACVRDDIGVLKVYINGVHDDSQTDTSTINLSVTNLMVGGSIYPGFENYADGYISNVRLSSTARYTADFTPPTENLTSDSDTIALVCQNNRYLDNSSNAYDVSTVAGNTKISAFNPFGQESEYAVGGNKGSGYFDGSDALDTETTLKNLGTSDFTIEMFLYPEDVDNICVIDTRNESNIGWMIFMETVGICFYINGNRKVQSTIDINQWVHVAITGESGTIKLFINGVSVDTASYSSSLDSGDDFRIGAKSYSASSTLPYEGFISDLKVTKGTALYTTNFTPPTAPVGNTNASLYLPMDNAGIFDKTGTNTITLFGNPSTSTTQTKFADTSMYFDGSGDYIKTEPNKFNNQSDYTVEYWIYWNSVVSDYEHIWENRLGGEGFAFYGWGGGYRLANNVAGLPVFGSGRTTGVWYHHACVWSNGSMKIYIDGTLIHTYADARTMASRTGYSINVDYAPHQSNIWIENFQVSQIEKYTSNFTPPTKTQGIVYQATS